MIGKNNRERILMMVGVMATWMLLIVIILQVPSKQTVELNEMDQTIFVNLAERDVIRSTFRVRELGLERLDILFKNPNLESRDELEISLYDADNRMVLSRVYTGFNFGDTSHARFDFPKRILDPGEELTLEIRLTRRLDGKLMVGTKSSEIDFIQYYDPSTRDSLGNRIIRLANDISRQPVIVILPLVTLVLGLW